MAEYTVSAILKVTDQATRPLRGISSSFSRLNRPIKGLDFSFSKLNIIGGKAFGSLFKWSKRAAFALTGLGVAGGYAVLKYSQLGDEIAKSADKLGISTDLLQAWQFAAEQGGLEAERFTDAFRFFNRSIAEAQKGTKENLEAFEDLRIGLKNGRGEWKDNATLFKEVADKLGAMKDPTKRTEIAMSLFSRSGADLLNIFKEGSKGLDNFRKQLEARGGIIPERHLRASEAFNDSLNRLKWSFRGLVFSGLGPLIPNLTGAVGKIEAFVIANNKLISQKVQSWMKKVIESSKSLWEWLKKVDALGELKIFLEWNKEVFWEVKTALSWILGGFEKLRKFYNEPWYQKMFNIVGKTTVAGGLAKEHIPNLVGAVSNIGRSIKEDLAMKGVLLGGGGSSQRGRLDINIKTPPGIEATIGKVEEPTFIGLHPMTQVYLGMLP